MFNFVFIHILFRVFWGRAIDNGDKICYIEYKIYWDREEHTYYVHAVVRSSQIRMAIKRQFSFFSGLFCHAYLRIVHTLSMDIV